MSRHRCITHHHACDCREWDHAREIERLTAEICRLREAFRVNALIWRPGTTDAEIDRVLYPEPVRNAYGLPRHRNPASALRQSRGPIVRRRVWQ